MPTARTARSRSTAAEPIISPAWSPNGKELAYVSFEKQKAVVFVQTVATGERRAIADFRGSNSAPAWSPDGQTLAVTLSRDGGSQLFLIGRNGEQPAPPHHQPGDRHRGRVLAPTAAGSTSPATAAAARRSTACRPAAAAPSASPSAAATTSARRSAPTAARSPTSRRSGNAFRLATLDLSAPGAQPTMLTDTSDDEQPELRAERPAAHLRHASRKAAAC